jgi:hypothetical protein
MAVQEMEFKKQFKEKVSLVAKRNNLTGRQIHQLAVSVLASDQVKNANKKKVDYQTGDHLRFIMSKPSCKAITLADRKLEEFLRDEWVVAFELLGLKNRQPVQR